MSLKSRDPLPERPSWLDTADGREARGPRTDAEWGYEPEKAPSPAKPRDLKQSAGKPQVSQRPFAPAIWAARVYEYGASKYARGNYLRDTDLTPEDRASNYLDAAIRHLYQQAEQLERYRGEALYAAADKSAAGLGLDGPGYILLALDEESGLPHLAHALVSLEMLIAQLVQAGAAPKDPGQKLFRGAK